VSVSGYGKYDRKVECIFLVGCRVDVVVRQLYMTQRFKHKKTL